MTGAQRKNVLFLCTGNSCRSQIAEGWTKHLKRAQFEPYSAGVKVKGVDPRAVKAMAEAGIDISEQSSKMIDDLPDVEFDYVITLCDHARESCPFFPAKTRVMHAGFEDPPELAKNASDEEEAMRHYRKIRDEIKAFIESLPDALLK
ncbi:MAG: arsenate reductase ArsC [Deltaproteobacteria bacterium]|nr:arsenate reductase ArsC [Deltaproteobacteria bacterium]MBW2052643.1 arsenate reductase ArsC [Deltaproteobacteria bacterium]MBW2140548.1 arsenate reductase ArsC [Deltaproteobacteria bacterium]MBW2323048.1 arsenate reductase ArsC [Deltaproteobacteria bacterium]